MDYDSARHHLEAVQNAKKKDEAKIAKVKKKKKKPGKASPVTLGLGNDKFHLQGPEGSPCFL